MAENNLKEMLVAKMENFFVENDWKSYEYNEGYSTFEAGVTLKCKLKSTRMYVSCRDNGLSFRFAVNIGTDDSCETQAMEFVTRANNGLTFGGFQMDLERKTIEYVTFIPCDDVPSNGMIDYAIFIGISMWNRYGDELLAVIFGMKNAKDAIEEAERKMRG